MVMWKSDTRCPLIPAATLPHATGLIILRDATLQIGSEVGERLWRTLAFSHLLAPHREGPDVFIKPPRRVGCSNPRRVSGDRGPFRRRPQTRRPLPYNPFHPTALGLRADRPSDNVLWSFSYDLILRNLPRVAEIDDYTVENRIQSCERRYSHASRVGSSSRHKWGHSASA